MKSAEVCTLSGLYGSPQKGDPCQLDKLRTSWARVCKAEFADAVKSRHCRQTSCPCFACCYYLTVSVVLSTSLRFTKSLYWRTLPLCWILLYFCDVKLVYYCQHDWTHFLPLKYWATRGYKKPNVRCGIFYRAFGIISLAGKHLGLTFSVYWLETFLSPLLQKSGCIMLQEAVTRHFVVSLDLSGENEKLWHVVA